MLNKDDDKERSEEVWDASDVHENTDADVADDDTELSLASDNTEADTANEAVDIVGDESELFPTHEALDLAGEDDARPESFEMETASGDDASEDDQMETIDQDDGDDEEFRLGDPNDDLDSQVELELRVFDPMELTPKMREMHEALSLRSQIEAAIFASPKPLKAADLVELVSFTKGLKEVEKTLQDLKEEYATREGGFTLEYVKGMGYQFQSVPAAAPLMEGLFSSRPRPLSRAALETLSIIAYRQPCTRAVVEFIRGVDSGSIIKNLMDRELIKCVGRKEDSGRPMLFGTTDEFLAVFGIRSLDELPSLQSFQPASETLQQALDELDELEREVDVEDFVGDDTEEHPELGEGLLDVEAQNHAGLDADQVSHEASEGADEETSASAETVLAEETIEASEQAGYEEELTAKPIQGAVKADEEYDDDTEREDRADPEVDSPDGEILTAGSREVDPGGADLS